MPEHFTAARLPEPVSPMMPLSHVPVQLTSFVGRERELAEVRRLLTTTRLLTLTGPGGCGKTRLCFQVASDLLDSYADGVCTVELGSLVDQSLVPQALIKALGLAEVPGQPLHAILADHLRSRELLLAVDNCEHLLDACGLLVDGLLRACPHLQIITTSREPLRISGETVWQVPPMDLPDLRRPPHLDALLRNDAVRLFAAQAQAPLPAFAIHAHNAEVVAQICCQLDGMPLALELAAAWVRVLSAEEIEARLVDRFRLLTGGSRTADPRQRTLRAAMDWSHDLLSPAERTMFHRLAVFAGGFTLQACEHICTGDGIDSEDALDLVSRLVDKSLVTVEGQSERRYRLLHTVRQYGLEKLAESGAGGLLRNRHKRYYLQLAQQGDRELAGPGQDQWVALLEEEHDNLRATLQWAAQEGDAGSLLRLSLALSRFWRMRGHFGEGRRWLEKALAVAPEWTADRALALREAGVLAASQGDYAAAGLLYEESLSICREVSERADIAPLLNNLGLLAYYQGQVDQALKLYAESLEIRRATGDKPGIAVVLNNLAMALSGLGKLEQARPYVLESLSIKRECGDKAGIANTLNSLGILTRMMGDVSEAIKLAREALSLAKDLGNRGVEANTLHALGFAILEQGDPSAAEGLFRESLIIRRDIVDRPGIVECLEGLADAAARQGRAMQAMRLYGAVERLRESLRASMLTEERRSYEKKITALRRCVDERTYLREWNLGRDTPLEQIMAWALSEAERAPSAVQVRHGEVARHATHPGDLTDREVEIVGLVARGLSDREIATRLVISPRTVDKHLRNTFAKVQVSSRAALVAWAFRNGIAEAEG